MTGGQKHLARCLPAEIRALCPGPSVSITGLGARNPAQDPGA